MPTRESVLNDALDLLGEPRAAGPDDSASWVVRLRDAYDARVRALLENYPWNFASELEQLVATEPTPADWDYGFRKPASFLRLIALRGSADPDASELDYDDRGGRFLTNSAGSWLWYVSSTWITLEGAWPQVFADAVSSDLAFRCSAATAEANTTRETLAAIAQKALREARTWDAMQKPFRRHPPGEWVRARSGGWRR